METYMKVYRSKTQAYNSMITKNRACLLTNNYKTKYCLVKHPDGYAVVDIMTAIEVKQEIGIPYIYSSNY